MRDISFANNMSFAILRYFNVAGADPKGRSGQITKPATHLIKVACETALGLEDNISIYGTDYDTKDGSCIRDFIHVSDLVDIHYQALLHLLQNQGSIKLNCGYGEGYSVLDVIEETKKVSGNNFCVVEKDRRKGDPPS